MLHLALSRRSIANDSTMSCVLTLDFCSVGCCMLLLGEAHFVFLFTSKVDGNAVDCRTAVGQHSI